MEVKDLLRLSPQWLALCGVVVAILMMMPGHMHMRRYLTQAPASFPAPTRTRSYSDRPPIACEVSSGSSLTSSPSSSPFASSSPSEPPPTIQHNYQRLSSANHLLQPISFEVVNDGRRRSVATALQKAFSRDGFLFLRDVLPKDSVLDLRQDIIRILHDHAWIDSTQPGDRCTIVGPGITPKVEVEEDKDYWPVFHKLQRLRSFHGLPHHPKLINVLDMLFGQRSFCHPRKLGRMFFPNHTAHRTPPHQDWVFVQGEPPDSAVLRGTITAWIPIGDVPVGMGGLCVLQSPSGRAHQEVLQMTEMGPGVVGINTSELESRGCKWATADYKAGDVLLLSSRAIHRGGDNAMKQMRLSMDARFAIAGAPITDGPLQVHYNKLSWDDVYESWATNDPLRYYWKQDELNVVAFDRYASTTHAFYSKKNSIQPPSQP
eukprot:m.187439 g.187439  ORF g.187439 m.187439 type:complete len:431 (+) comp32306_c1_seq4:283-1575(+)